MESQKEVVDRWAYRREQVKLLSKPKSKVINMMYIIDTVLFVLFVDQVIYYSFEF